MQALLLDHQQGPLCEAMWRAKTKGLRPREAPQVTGQSIIWRGLHGEKRGHVLEFIALDYGEPGYCLGPTVP
jgi:hypothetical protein